jgi:signal transduction histidine kinase
MGVRVRNRVVGLAVLISILAISMFGLPLAAVAAKYAADYETAELERTADTAAIAVAADLVRGDSLSVPSATREDTEVAVYEHHQGRRVAGEGPAEADRQVREALDGVVQAGKSGDSLVVAIPVTHDGDVIGAVRAASPYIAVYMGVGAAWALMLGLAVLAIATVWVVARQQAGRLATPLERLAESARRLGEGQFGIQVHPVRVPEIDALGAALDGAAQQLDQMLARERAFSADASHQLRTPLTGLRLRLEAALDREEQDLRSAVEAAISAADRLEDTIRELLTLARDTRDGATIPLDLAGIIDEIRVGWRARLAAEGRRLRIEDDEWAPPAMVSTAAVRQVLAVLLENAAAHGKGAVTVTIRGLPDALAIDVSDEGGPIKLTESELFARRSVWASGHGIGLALARRLAEAEGGRLRLTSPNPSTFTVLLPTTDAANGAEPNANLAGAPQLIDHV